MTGIKKIVPRESAARETWRSAGRLMICTLLLCGWSLSATVELMAQAAPPADVLQAQQQRVETIAAASQATITVYQQGGQGGGSGVIISPDGLALTNFHVTGTGPALECGLPGGRIYPAVVVGLDPTGDVALIQLFGEEEFPTAPLGDSDLVRMGDWVFTAGNPFLLANDFEPSIAYGIVSGTHRYQYPSGTLLEYADCIQTDAAINPGNSGGPLFNAQGEVIGINGRGSFEKRGRVNVGVGYAISINQIKRFLGYLKSGRVVDHASLGARAITAPDGSVVVDQILDSSNAFRRGLRYDDEIVRLGDRQIDTVNALKNALGVYPRHWVVPMTYRRDGRTYDTWVRLPGAHREGELEGLMQQAPGQAPPGDDPEDGPDKNPLDMVERDDELPPAVAEHYEKRRGFANYYYNRRAQQRLWQARDRMGDFSALTQAWNLRGEDGNGRGFEIELSGSRGVASLPAGRFEARLENADLSSSTAPPGTGGLLVALHLWKRFLVVPPARFGDVYYLGQTPLPDHQSLVDTLVGVHGGVETFFHFDQEGSLVSLEAFVIPDWDPCEVRFTQYHRIEGRRVPKLIEVWHGRELYSVLRLDSITWAAESEEAHDTDSEDSQRAVRPADEGVSAS